MRTLAYLLKAYQGDPATSADIQKVYDFAKSDDLDGINTVLKMYEGTDDLYAIASAAKAAFADMPFVSVDSEDKALAEALLELTKTLSVLTAQSI